MRTLSPPLSVIESNLFDSSPALVRRWAEGDASLPAETRTALEADEVARALREDLEAGPADAGDLAPESAIAIPADLAEAVRLRVATANRRFSAKPRPGLILRVHEAIGPDGPLGWDMARPLAVLLSEPTEHTRIWYGWLMSWETDYATWWDMLLEDKDEPYDPNAAMVQAWNPVHLYIPSACAPLGELSAERLAAVRDLADDLAGARPEPAEAAPGTLVQRTTTGGRLVLTGSPPGDASDPRHRYRQLYFEAAKLLREVATLAQARLGEQAAMPWWQRVLEDLRAAAAGAEIPLEPEPTGALSVKVPPAEAGSTYRLGDWVRLRLIPSPEGDAVQIHLTLLGEDPLVVGLARGDKVRQQERLTPDAPEADLFAGADRRLTLFIRDSAGDLVFSKELPSGSAVE